MSYKAEQRVVRKAALRLGTLLALLLALLVVPRMEARADAWGAAYWSAFQLPTPWGTYPVPAGYITGEVEGSRLVVTEVLGTFRTASSSISNWHFSVQFFDLNNRNYATFDQPNQPRTSANGGFRWVPRGGVFRARPGRVCIKLYTHGWKEVAAVCHSIHQ